MPWAEVGGIIASGNDRVFEAALRLTRKRTCVVARTSPPSTRSRDCSHYATSHMRREIEIRNKAEKDLKAIPKRDGERIAKAIIALQSGSAGDIKRLTNFTPEYRLRVGDWRVLFEMDSKKITIYRILHRREAYRG